ncbi:MAG: glycogen synthase GlgA [Candidatus Omnitrophica bacterium]|nr:glycogen synthase GlgA [Candidatus Omnitrophota bacterium]
MKIVMCASEVVPFAKTGGLADVAGALPAALEKAGHEVIVIMPGYKMVHAKAGLGIKQVRDGLSAATLGKAVKVYFIDHDFYFGRDALYGDKSGDYIDNIDRFSYFCRRTLDLLKEINFKADIIHCHDWQSALVPVYVRSMTYSTDPFYKGMRTVFTIHNIGYQGLFSKDEFPKLGLSWSFFGVEALEYYDRINCLKGGIMFSDVINTVSDTYSKEIRTKEFGFGMEGVLDHRKDSLFGIINGLDYSIWDPAVDTFIAEKFSAQDPAGKAACKEDLQKLCKFPVKKNVPLIGVVSRLAQQKGFDIVAEGIDRMCRMSLQMVILGTGDAKYHEIMEKMIKKYPKVISLHLKFDDALAHKIYAGSDIFLMPSRYEPCGLGQMISMKYGTLPLVFKTGGLADTVDASNGFVFGTYSADELLKTVKKALSAYESADKWKKLVAAAMRCDFSWSESAKKYIQLYEKARKKI